MESAENPDSHPDRLILLTPHLPATYYQVRACCLISTAAFWCCWTIVLAVAAGQDASLAGWLLCATAWSSATLYLVWYNKPMLATVRPESIRLTTDKFHYDPGNVGAMLGRLGFLYLFIVRFSYSGKTPPLSFTKSEFRLKLTDDVWRGGGRRLLLTWDERDFEIGALLTDAERTAIYNEMEAWRASPAIRDVVLS